MQKEEKGRQKEEKERTREDGGGQGRNASCALLFCNWLIILHINHQYDVKCVDFAIYKKNKIAFYCIVHFNLPITQRTSGLDAS